MQESGGTVLAKSMYRVLSEPFLCTPMTVGYWACVGRVGSMWPALKLYDAVADAMLWILENQMGWTVSITWMTSWSLEPQILSNAESAGPVCILGSACGL